MTDDPDRPRPGTPGGEDDASREALRRRPPRDEEDPATEALRWNPDADAARGSSRSPASDAEYADDAVSRASGWSLGADDDATQTFTWDDDPPAIADDPPAIADEPPPIDRSLDGAPPLDPQPPTEAMAWETAVVPEVAPGGPVPRTADASPTGPTGIDALFHPGSFRDFEPTTVLPREPALVGATAVRTARTGPSMTPGQRMLLWAAGVLVAILVLLALFAIGRRLPAMFAAAPAPVESASPTPTPTPEPVDPVAGPVPPGEHAWDELRGGECLEPFESAWQEDFTVVDCGDTHAAQLLVRAEFPEDVAPDGAYPGFDELTRRINQLCTDPDVVDFDAAREYDDIVVEGAYAVTPEEWADGHRDYFCFVTRSSGEPLSGSLALPREG